MNWGKYLFSPLKLYFHQGGKLIYQSTKLNAKESLLLLLLLKIKWGGEKSEGLCLIYAQWGLISGLCSFSKAFGFESSSITFPGEETGGDVEVGGVDGFGPVGNNQRSFGLHVMSPNQEALVQKNWRMAVAVDLRSRLIHPKLHFTKERIWKDRQQGFLLMLEV